VLLCRVIVAAAEKIRQKIFLLRCCCCTFELRSKYLVTTVRSAATSGTCSMANSNNDSDAEAAMKVSEKSSLLGGTLPNLSGSTEDTSDDACHAAVLRAKCMIAARWAQMGVFYSYIGIFFAAAKKKGGDGFTLMHIGYLMTALMGGMTLGSYTLPVLADHCRRHVTLGLAFHVLMTTCMGLLMAIPRGNFCATLFFLCLGSFWNGGYGPIVDSAVFQICGKFRDRTSFGHIRLWGCVSWAIGALAVSLIMDKTKNRWYYYLNTFLIAYVVLSPFTFYFSYNLLRAEFPSGSRKSKAASTTTSGEGGTISSLKRLLLFPLTPPFYAAVICLGMLFAALNAFVYIWAVDDLGASYTQVGVATAVLNCCEVGIFLGAKAISRRIGTHGVLYMSAAAYAFRLALYGYFVKSAWWLVLGEPFHALTFSLPMGSLGACTNAIADASDCPRTTAQGFRTGTMNLGRAAGFIVSAWLFQHISAATMFRGMLIAIVPCMFLSVMLLHRSAVALRDRKGVDQGHGLPLLFAE
jgi:hypothetical protein